VKIAPYGLVEGFGLYLVQLGQVCIEHHFLAADEINPALYQPHWYGQALRARMFL